MNSTKKRITQKEIAHSANISPDFLSHIIRGRRRCPRDAALRLEKVTGISKVVWVWGTPEEIRSAVHEYKHQQGQQNGY
ncbi:helix-turn-helix transcriptional regulator [Desulfogranum marinum]|uniref:helix-turn-helix transcriptional regulator n=1 Tax=Desulfogranum marinum TaxID=453220 RepID=UPI001963BAD7|nr:helix-turn-helix transcriptional regulator [Desulfogranum marinum]MBM9514054.1 helix-turn-helix transcriptional regulator [Desulfogranum marinum]